MIETRAVALAGRLRKEVDSTHEEHWDRNWGEGFSFRAGVWIGE